MKSLHIRVSDDEYLELSQKSQSFGISMNEYIKIGIALANEFKSFEFKKHCTACSLMLPLSSYSNKNGGKYGKNSICKSCAQIKQRTKEGHIIQLYSSQRKASRLKNYDMPNYTSKELITWCLNQPVYHKLYDNWVKSGFDKKLSPSCDRLDDYKPYSFDNLQIVTWEQNLKNEWSRRKKGENAKQSKRVGQFTMYMEYITSFPSIREASRATNTNYGNLGECCRGKTSHAGGFIWKFI